MSKNRHFMTLDNYNRKFKKEIGAISELFVFAESFIEKHQLSPETAYSLTLAIEEIFTNMVKYSKKSQNDISLSLEKKNGQVEVILIDYDAERFEPESLNESDMDELRNVGSDGGRGVYLVQKVVDKLEFEYKDNNSIVRIIKKTE